MARLVITLASRATLSTKKGETMDKTKAAYIAAGADPVLIGKMFTIPAPQQAEETPKKPAKKTAKKAK